MSLSLSACILSPSERDEFRVKIHKIAFALALRKKTSNVYETASQIYAKRIEDQTKIWHTLIEEFFSKCKTKPWIKEQDICVEGLTNQCKLSRCKMCSIGLTVEEKIEMVQILILIGSQPKLQRSIPTAAKKSFPALGEIVRKK